MSCGSIVPCVKLTDEDMLKLILKEVCSLKDKISSLETLLKGGKRGPKQPKMEEVSKISGYKVAEDGGRMLCLTLADQRKNCIKVTQDTFKKMIDHVAGGKNSFYDLDECVAISGKDIQTIG